MTVKDLSISVANWAGVVFCSLLLAGCAEQGLNVVVFNYWPRAMADVYIDGQRVGTGFGAYGPAVRRSGRGNPSRSNGRSVAERMIR